MGRDAFMPYSVIGPAPYSRAARDRRHTGGSLFSAVNPSDAPSFGYRGWLRPRMSFREPFQGTHRPSILRCTRGGSAGRLPAVDVTRPWVESSVGQPVESQ